MRKTYRKQAHMFLTTALFYGFILYLLYIGWRFMFQAKMQRVVFTGFMLFISYVIWEYYIQTERAQTEAPNYIVIGSLIVLIGATMSLVPSLKKDAAAHDEEQRQLADKP